VTVSSKYVFIEDMVWVMFLHVWIADDINDVSLRDNQLRQCVHMRVLYILAYVAVILCLLYVNMYIVLYGKKTNPDRIVRKKDSINMSSVEVHSQAKKSTLLSVCVLIPVSSLGQNWGHVEDSFVVRMALRNARNTSEEHMYNYTFYIGYDQGDDFFDNMSTVADMRQWFGENMGQMHLKMVSFLNPHRKPGPIMNALSQEAYSDGCDFMYRINDDTELLTPWTSAFILALESFTPPYMGVVGPTCQEGNTAILTHDFVHRWHLDLFGTHYPPELTDWWLDDWISSVYGPRSTLKLADVVVRHHVVSTRYGVTWENKGLLAAALHQGRLRIKALNKTQ